VHSQASLHSIPAATTALHRSRMLVQKLSVSLYAASAGLFVCMRTSLYVRMSLHACVRLFPLYTGLFVCMRRSLSALHRPLCMHAYVSFRATPAATAPLANIRLLLPSVSRNANAPPLQSVTPPPLLQSVTPPPAPPVVFHLVIPPRH
jgi:hypothetical protein